MIIYMIIEGHSFWKLIFGLVLLLAKSDNSDITGQTSLSDL